jgi:hypothetical protein
VKPALIISERDNVATALEALEAGRHVTLGPTELTIRERIPHGHKVALTASRWGSLSSSTAARSVWPLPTYRPARTCTPTTWRAAAAAATST